MHLIDLSTMAGLSRPAVLAAAVLAAAVLAAEPAVAGRRQR